MTKKEGIRSILSSHLANALFSVDLPVPKRRGKVRDLYEFSEELWMVVTDRVSAFDQVLGTIPLKGALLAEQTCFWFEKTSSIIKNHLLHRPDPQILICQKSQPIMVEVVVRGFLAGSLMRENPLTRGSAYGLSLDPDLRPYQKFATPIITPTTKAEHGQHDMPISSEQIISANLLEQKHWHQVLEVALALFNEGNRICEENGFYLVDTKYEFGLLQDQLILIDEIHTADSSRFFAIDDYHQCMAQGHEPNMLDKEFLRKKLMEDGFDPNFSNLTNLTLDDDLRLEVGCRYFELTERLLGKNFSPPLECSNGRVPKKLMALIDK
jgi:phosphoribosylaminoimidazole-succinocarboxamide synthase